MAGDYGKFRVGNVVYPLDATLYQNPLAAIDPFTDNVTKYLSAMIQVYMGDMWDAVVTDIGRPEFVGEVVAYTLPYDPIPYFTEEQAKFPLLAIWRTESSDEERTFSWYHRKNIYKICYSLFPTTPAEAEKLKPFLKSAEDIIKDRCEQGYDPHYNNSEQVFSDGYSGIEKLTFFGQKTLEQGFQFKQKSNLWFPTLLISMEVDIREEFQRNFLMDMSGVDTTQLLDGYQFLQTEINLP